MPNLITSEECTFKYNFLNIFCNLRYTRIIQFESKIKISNHWPYYIIITQHDRSYKELLLTFGFERQLTFLIGWYKGDHFNLILLYPSSCSSIAIQVYCNYWHDLWGK